MNPSEILVQTHRTLFPGDEKAIKAAFRKLSKEWHPDRRNGDPEANRVFAHITEMHRVALGRSKPLSETFQRKSGATFRMEYRSHRSGNACEIYLGASSAAYLVADVNDALSDRASARKWTFANAKMKDEMLRFLPQLRREERLEGGRLFIYNRTPDQILMRDLIAHEGKIDPHHVAWMITRMMNIACYLQYANIAHLSISPDFLLVSLAHHGVSLTGPALYATAIGQRPKFAPARTVSLVPAMRRPEFVADSTIDRQLIRQIGMELLGDPSGNRLRSNPEVRPEVAQWLNSSPPASAFEDYTAWESCLGVRKFVIYPKTAQEIYAAN